MCVSVRESVCECECERVCKLSSFSAKNIAAHAREREWVGVGVSVCVFERETEC